MMMSPQQPAAAFHTAVATSPTASAVPEEETEVSAAATAAAAGVSDSPGTSSELKELSRDELEQFVVLLKMENRQLSHLVEKQQDEIDLTFRQYQSESILVLAAKDSEIDSLRSKLLHQSVELSKYKAKCEELTATNQKQNETIISLEKQMSQEHDKSSDDGSATCHTCQSHSDLSTITPLTTTQAKKSGSSPFWSSPLSFFKTKPPHEDLQHETTKIPSEVASVNDGLRPPSIIRSSISMGGSTTTIGDDDYSDDINQLRKEWHEWRSSVTSISEQVISPEKLNSEEMVDEWENWTSRRRESLQSPSQQRQPVHKDEASENTKRLPSVFKSFASV